MLFNFKLLHTLQSDKAGLLAMSTSQRAGILPITFITPILKPGPTHIALSNRQTLLAGRQAGTESTICRSMNIKKHWGTLVWGAGHELKGVSEQHLTSSVQQELCLDKQNRTFAFFFIS